MSDPSQFSKVVAGVFTTNIALKAVFTFLGALAYGEATGQILTENFSSSGVRSAVNVLIAVNTVMSFPLPLIPVFNAIRKYRNSENSTFELSHEESDCYLVWRCCGRYSKLWHCHGLMGSITLPFLTFIFPGLFYVRLHGSELSITMKLLCWFVLCLVLSVLSWVCFRISTVSELILP